MQIPEPMTPREQTFTQWQNPTAKEVALDLYVGADTSNPSGRVRYRVPAGGEVAIPSQFDRAIHDVREGVIVGGLGALLVKVGADETLEPCLDPSESAKKAAMEAAQNALIAKQAADEGMKLAAAKLAESEQAKPAKSKG